MKIIKKNKTFQNFGNVLRKISVSNCRFCTCPESTVLHHEFLFDTFAILS